MSLQTFIQKIGKWLSVRQGRSGLMLVEWISSLRTSQSRFTRRAAQFVRSTRRRVCGCIWRPAWVRVGTWRAQLSTCCFLPGAPRPRFFHGASSCEEIRGFRRWTIPAQLCLNMRDRIVDLQMRLSGVNLGGNRLLISEAPTECKLCKQKHGGGSENQ